jgi:cytochrome bd-type quinol oxidase subunit 1
MAKVTFCHVRSTLTDDMQEIQLLLVQSQTTLAQLAFELMALLGLGLVWLLVALGPQSPWANAWRSLFSLVARLTIGLGLLWLPVMVSAWPPLLERTGNVLGPMIAGLVAVMLVTETLAYRLAQHPSHGLRSMAAWLTAIGFSLAFALVLLAQSWMREPMGAALIDGRY